MITEYGPTHRHRVACPRLKMRVYRTKEKASVKRSSTVIYNAFLPSRPTFTPQSFTSCIFCSSRNWGVRCCSSSRRSRFPRVCPFPDLSGGASSAIPCSHVSSRSSRFSVSRSAGRWDRLVSLFEGPTVNRPTCNCMDYSLIHFFFVHDGILIPSGTIVLQAWVSSVVCRLSSVVSPILKMGFFPNALS